MATFGTAVVCLVTALALVSVYLVVRQKNVVELEVPAAAATTLAPALLAATSGSPPPTSVLVPTTVPPPMSPPSAVTTTIRPTATPAASAAPTITTVVRPATTAPRAADPITETTFPPADPAAKNFLITGVDNGACVSPDSAYASTFGDRDELGGRSDTIMVVRVDPRHNRVAVLSFPRDLWVQLAGGGSMQRINSAYKRNEPQRLVDTIYEQFGISVDHYIQFDFCAFKTLVDAVGGVDVPFQYPARDSRSGLMIETAGCVNLDGDEALAYVRSRYYEYDTTGDGNWRRDRSSDLGRISRQQDFIRRTLATVSGKGLMNPDVVRGMLRAADRYVVTDRQLTPRKILEFAGVMRNVDPDSIMTYQIAATPRVINGNDVLIPDLDGALMRDVLALFRGELSLGDAPAEATLPATSSTTVTTTASTTNAASSTSIFGTISPAASSDVPVRDSTGPVTQRVDGSSISVPVQEVIGVVPPVDQHC